MGRTEVCRCQELDDLSELLLGSASAGESDMWIGWLAQSAGWPTWAGRQRQFGRTAWPG